MNTTIDERRGSTSASKAPGDLLCAGRHLAQRGLPETTSADAQFGREIHAALADSGSRAIMEKLTGEQRDIFDSCREIEKKLIEQVFGDDPTPKRVFREQRYWVKVRGEVVIPADGSGPSPTIEHKQEVLFEHSGQPDVVIRAGPKGLIIEYKTLPGDVPESPANLQLRDQAVLASGHLLLAEVAVAVIQPLVTHTPLLTLYNKDALKQAETEMFERVRKSNDPNSPRTAGEVQCNKMFCKAKGVCKEYAQWAATLLPEKPSPLTVAMQEWSVEQRVTVAEHLPRLKKLLADAEDFLKDALAADENAVPGFHLKEGNTRETINDAQELFNRFTAIAGGRAADIAVEKDAINNPEFHESKLILEWFMQCVSITKGKLEEQVRVVTNTKGRALKAKMDGLLAGIVDVKQNAPSLARRKDV